MTRHRAAPHPPALPPLTARPVLGRGDSSSEQVPWRGGAWRAGLARRERGRGGEGDGDPSMDGPSPFRPFLCYRPECGPWRLASLGRLITAPPSTWLLPVHFMTAPPLTWPLPASSRTAPTFTWTLQDGCGSCSASAMPSTHRGGGGTGARPTPWRCNFYLLLCRGAGRVEREGLGRAGAEPGQQVTRSAGQTGHARYRELPQDQDQP